MKFLFALVGGLALSGCAAPLSPSVEPAQNAVFCSTREIRALRWNSRTANLWAATGGGILRFGSGKWTKWTRESGLPANESFEIADDGMARFPLASARFEGESWETKAAPPYSKTAPTATWNGATVRATLEGLDLGSRVEPLPSASGGTHISAILPMENRLETAIYGDGLWSFDGAKWTRDAQNVPPDAREVTALASDSASHTLWLGTRRGGIWRRTAGKWSQFRQGNEIPAHNIQFLTKFQGVLWASTLDDGLVYRAGSEWKPVSVPDISSVAPRQLWVWHDTLWVRHGAGVVDSFDGRTWTKNALGTIPRPGIYALGGDEKRLLASGWGGFAEWDGTTWTPHYDVPDLMAHGPEQKGIPILGVSAQGEDVWLLTQSRGIGVWDRATQKLRWLDERAGLPDDWVTTLGEFGGKTYAGTFVGGLARLDGDQWFVFPELKGENVTSLCQSPDGSVLAATRHGIWKIEGDSAQKLPLAWLDSEDQALLSDEHGVWIGARTSLNFWRVPATDTKSKPD